MIEQVRAIYRRLDRLQRHPILKIVLLAVILISAGVIWGRLVVTATSLASQRANLTAALTDANHREGDPIAVDLYELGTFDLNGRTYGSELLASEAIRDTIFNPAGFVAFPDGLAQVLVQDRYPDWAPVWLIEQPATTILLAVASTGILLGTVLTSSLLGFLLTGVITGTFWLVCSAAKAHELAFAGLGIGLLIFAYVLLSNIAMQALDRPNRVCAVAHTVIREAMRTGIPLVFIVTILVVLPLLPLGLDADQPLRYRIQAFLSRSIGVSYYLAACMTLFLACATVTFEIRDRQIWQVLTKPVSHGAYILGKWLGIVAVNAIILLVASISIFGYVQYQRQLPVASGLAGQEDIQQIRDAVLTARLGIQPAYPTLSDGQLRARVDARIQRDPELALMEDVPMETRRSIASDIRQEFDRAVRSVPPARAANFEFTGIATDLAADEMLTLRYRFHMMRDDEHETFDAVFVFNENQDYWIEQEFIPTMSHTLSVPASLVREDGTLTVTVQNMFQGQRQVNGFMAGSINWDPDDFELLYRVSSFEANYFRAMLVHMVKLAFLAMLGVACGTFLSFPVACLTAFTIFIAGTAGPFVAEALWYYEPLPVDRVDFTNIGMVIEWAFKWVIQGLATAVVFLLESFGKINPTQRLVEGRLLSWGSVAESLLRIGFLWCGLALTIGWAVMRRRQLAIYSGQG